MRRVLKVLGYLLVALLMASLLGRVLMAAVEGRPFYGRNSYGLAVGTYSTLAGIGIVAGFGMVWLVQRLMKSWAERRADRRHREGT